MPTEVQTVYNVTEWLTLKQIYLLLAAGELVIKSPTGDTRLYIQFCDRAEALAFAEKNV